MLIGRPKELYFETEPKYFVKFDRNPEKSRVDKISRCENIWEFNQTDIKIDDKPICERLKLKLLGSNELFPIEIFCYDYHTRCYDCMMKFHVNINNIVNEIHKRTNMIVDDINIENLKIIHNKIHDKTRKISSQFNEKIYDIYTIFNKFLYIVNYGNTNDIKNLVDICSMIDKLTCNETKLFNECFRLISISNSEDIDDYTGISIAIIPYVRTRKTDEDICDFNLMLVETFFGDNLRRKKSKYSGTILSGYATCPEYISYRNGKNWESAFMNTVKRELFEETSAVIDYEQIVPIMKRKVRYTDIEKDIFIFGVELSEKNIDEIKNREMYCEETTKIDLVNSYWFVYQTHKHGWRDQDGLRKTIVEKIYRHIHVHKM